MYNNMKVDGQLNTGSVHNIAEQMNFGGGPEHKPESQLQEEFYRRTGIWCPRSAREDFEWLMKEKNFTSRDLERAWRYRFLIWALNNQRLGANLSRIDKPFAHLVVTLISFMLLLPAILQVFQNPDQPVFAGIAGSIAAFVMLLMGWFEYSLFRPRRVAIRVQTALGSLKSEGGLGND